jgi:HSP20 family protein
MTTKNETKEIMSKQPTQQSKRAQYLGAFDEFDQWFDDIRRNWMQPFFFGRNLPELGTTFGGRIPRVDIIDRDDEFCVRAELPGVSKENLDVTLQENILTIRASNQKEEREEKGQYFRQEMSRGEFQRIVRLPSPVEGDKVKAIFKDGVLELSIPKSANAQRQTIKVE